MSSQKYKIIQKPGQNTLWDQLIYGIIRPPQAKYDSLKLGPRAFCLKNGKQIQRKTKLINHQNEKLQISIFQQICDDDQLPQNLIIYCHCNSSNRLEGMQYIQHLPENFAFATFDFLGCGNTKEIFITLGVRQSQQLQSIYYEMKRQYKNIVLWGRSMGASTILKFGKCKINICDSPFGNLKKLGRELAQKIPKVPNCFIGCFFPCVFYKVRKDVLDKAQFDLQELNIIKSVEKMQQNQCLIIISSKEDQMISQKHSEQIFNNFKGKHKIKFEATGNHNQRRSRQLIQKIFKQIEIFLKLQNSDENQQKNQLI